MEIQNYLIAQVADNLAIALVSLKLHAPHQNLSVRKPMTQLFNSRYLDETLISKLSAI
ncbi:MAG: hypothetical protein WAW61_13600 [Methylococcaceae bacterium]